MPRRDYISSSVCAESHTLKSHVARSTYVQHAIKAISPTALRNLEEGIAVTMSVSGLL